ncbi:hypothetical protein AWM75_06410 [Aerococcus urinaehominis]|uniref:Uncharacterized protein n=1 Tax=Aerococcus urinaehominis TaxID=128944 RepID=A0A0X8FLS4_9LACT|nr:MaoC/PaaZ C-terminal domain-containing protein [Aerococcus urinaehominis]AMB99635.1 hypothetical protein AWM75_06410 [Aerococcus urinaehominis]SDL88350.1 MaoC like domain-containing protein [Aerococcus urinaehominis]
MKLTHKQILGPFNSQPINQATIQAYAQASGDFNPIHLDQAAAQAAGFDRQIVHGMLSMGICLQLLTKNFPSDSQFYDYDVKFSQPLLVDQAISLEAQVSKLDDHQAQLKLTARTLDQPDIIILKGKIKLKF